METRISGELRYLTLFPRGSVTIEHDGQKSAPDFDFDISRMNPKEKVGEPAN